MPAPSIPNELPNRIKRAMADKRWPNGFNPSYRKSLVTELQQYMESCKRTVETMKEIDPFWWYEPSDGSVNDEGMELLGKYIKREDIPARFDSALDVHKSKAGVVGVAGANQCLGSEEMIYDPVSESFKRISEIRGDFHVYAWDGRRRVIAKALQPFLKDVTDVYRVSLSDGAQFASSLEHRIFDGERFRYIHEYDAKPFQSRTQTAECSCAVCSRRQAGVEGLRASLVFRPPSIWEYDRSIRGASGLNFFETIQGFQCDCRFCRHFYGEPLHTVQDGAPSPGYALAHKEPVSSLLGARACRSSDIRSYRESRLPSGPDARPPNEGHGAGNVSRCVCRLCKSADGPRRAVRQPVAASCPGLSRRESGQPAGRFSGAFSSVGSPALTNTTYLRRDAVWDFTVPGYHNYIHKGIIHHNSGKTMTGMINDLIKATKELPKSLEGVAGHRVPTKETVRVRVTCKDYTNGILNHNLPLYRKWVPKDYLIDKDWTKSWSDKRNTLTLVNPKTQKISGTIEFMSNQAKAETFQGPPVDRCRYDEEPNKDIYDENLMRFTTSEKLDIELNMTPTAGLTWVYDDLFKEERTKTGEKIEWFKLVAVTNRYANLKVLDEAYSQIRDYDVLRMRALGEFVSLSGLVYGRYFKRSEHVIKPEDIGLGKGVYLKCNCEARYYENAHHRSGCPYPDYVAYLGVDPHEVKASTALILALDRNGNHYVDTTYREEKTMTEVARDINAMLKGYRYGFGKCDPHADSEKTAFDNRNIWKILTTGANRIPKLRKADAYRGSRLAGVDVIKGLLMPHPITKKPRLYIIDRPENELLIQSFRTLQRDQYRDEFAKGEKDEIMEGKHDHHACLRYILQTKLNWTPNDIPLMDAVSDVVAAGF